MKEKKYYGLDDKYERYIEITKEELERREEEADNYYPIDNSIEQRYHAFKIFMQYFRDNFDPNQEWSLEEYCQDFANEYPEFFECDYYNDNFYEDDDDE